MGYNVDKYMIIVGYNMNKYRINVNQKIWAIMWDVE